MIKTERDYVAEPMDTTELLYDDFAEEGEIYSSGDETNDRGVVKSENVSKDWTGGNRRESGLCEISEEEKKLVRAKRFAIPLGKTISVDSETLSHLHKTLGIDKENERHYRFNAVHMRGTQDMSTEDVTEYFASFTPSYIEWINDLSCNVIWEDDLSAARALLSLSKEIKNIDKIHLNADPFGKDLKAKEMEMDCNFASDVVDARDIKVAIPPGFWRIGVPCDKSPGILLRLATRSDRKQKNAEKNSEYYRRYGNPHFGNLPGLVSNSLRSGVFKRNRKYQFSDDGEDVDSRNDRKNPWGNLAQEWNEMDKNYDKHISESKAGISLKRPCPVPQGDLRYSINRHRSMAQRRPGPSHSSSQSEDENEEFESRAKFPRMKMYADEEQRNEGNMNRKKLSSQIRVPVVEDLRNKIDRRRRRKNEMYNSQYKRSTSRIHWNKFDTRDNYDNDDEDDDDDDDYEDERGSSNWALEQYSDLRESLEQNKKYKSIVYKKTIEQTESDESAVSDNASDEIYNGHLGHRSPLQIEIENDEYFEAESENSL